MSDVRISREDAVMIKAGLDEDAAMIGLVPYQAHLLNILTEALAAAPRPVEEAETVPDPAWGEELRIYTDGLDGKDSLALYGILQRQKRRLEARAAELEAKLPGEPE